MKLDSARKWHRRLDHMNQADGCGQESTRDCGGLDDVCNVFALATITKTPVPRVAETQAEEKLKRVFTDVMGPFRVEPLLGFQFCIVFADQNTKFLVRSFWDAQEAETRRCEGVSLGAVQDVLFRCRHSTGEDHTRDATTEWVS